MMAACLVACSSEDDPVAQPQPRLLTVEVAETTIVSASAPQQAPTRTAATTTTATLTAFSMNYQESQYNFTKTGDQWSTGTWPSGVGDDVEIDFYAYNGGTLNWSSSDPYVSFDMGESASMQKDLLVATTTSAFSDNGGKVTLTFDHACAAVRFTVRKSVTQSVIITSVVLDGVKSKGEYHYANSAWESLSTAESPVSYTLTDANNMTLTEEKQQLPCGYLFIIPQSKEGLTLKVNYTVGGVAKNHDFNLTGEWKAGHSYTININMGNNVIKAQ